jgi:hypothetical protein
MDINLAMVEPTDDGVLENLAKKSIRHGEEALLLAVLKSATEDFQKYVNARERKGKLLFSEAEEWFLNETSDSLCSFENICEVLRIKPNYFRKGLVHWKEAHRTPFIAARHSRRRSLESLVRADGNFAARRRIGQDCGPL